MPQTQNDADLIPVYDSQGAAYQEAFRAFLEHTDQKVRAQEWLDRSVAALPSRRCFIDAGAGTGKVTAWYAEQFDRCVAIEPNPHLRTELVVNCPTAEVVPSNILDARPAMKADLILVSHVFYYIPRDEWLRHLEMMSSWLSDTGVLVVALQNQGTDCMRMLRHFLNYGFDLAEAAREFAATQSGRCQIEVETVPARIEAPDLETISTIAAFMLNLDHDRLAHATRRPTWGDVRRFLADNARIDGGFRLSCNQDFLKVALSLRER